VDLKKKLKRSVDPDILFLEPSEMVVTSELRSVLSMGLRDIEYTVGPLITLIDGPTFTFNFEERKRLLLGQIRETDRIAISRIDLIDEKKDNHICESLEVRKNDLLLMDRNATDNLDLLSRQILSMDENIQRTI